MFNFYLFSRKDDTLVDNFIDSKTANKLYVKSKVLMKNHKEIWSLVFICTSAAASAGWTRLLFDLLYDIAESCGKYDNHNTTRGAYIVDDYI